MKEKEKEKGHAMLINPQPTPMEFFCWCKLQKTPIVAYFGKTYSYYVLYHRKCTIERSVWSRKKFQFTFRTFYWWNRIVGIRHQEKFTPICVAFLRALLLVATN